MNFLKPIYLKITAGKNGMYVTLPYSFLTEIFLKMNVIWKKKILKENQNNTARI